MNSKINAFKRTFVVHYTAKEKIRHIRLRSHQSRIFLIFPAINKILYDLT